MVQWPKGSGVAKAASVLSMRAKMRLKIALAGFLQPGQRRVRSLGPGPDRAIEQDRVDARVGEAFERAGLDAGLQIGGVDRALRIREIEIGDDVARVHDRDVAVDEHRHFRARIDREQARAVRVRQAVDRFVIETLVGERHRDLAREGREAVAEEGEHGVPGLKAS